MKTLIFDLDGTLLDSMPVWDQVGYNLLIKHGITPPPDLEERIKSMSFEQSARYFNEQLGLNRTVPQVLEEIIHMVEDAYQTEIPLKPFVFPFLQQMASQNAHMCVLTASEESYVLAALERLKIAPFFEQVFTCTKLGMSKSSSEIYQVVAQKMEASQQEVVVFEDALHAVENAKKAGFYTIGVFDKTQQEDWEKIQQTADRTILSFEELLPF